MINVRLAMLHELEQARTRKQLLTQQSEQLLQNGTRWLILIALSIGKV